MDYYQNTVDTKKKLDSISPTVCMAKWFQVSMHLPSGLTHSCYHPPAHKIPLEELERHKSALHNTEHKISERALMRDGKRPEGCNFCWDIEDAANGPHLSDRHYRSSEEWVPENAWEMFKEIDDRAVKPTYVEVNFNQACNFKCVYCSPHLSTTWEQEVVQYGPVEITDGYEHNNIEALTRSGLMPLPVKQKENPYVTAFWEWWPELYPSLKVFRMTGGEPLMDKNTFKVLEYVNEHPNSDLSISITSNMCPPDDKLMDRFIELVQKTEQIQIWEDRTKFNKDSGNYHYISPACRHINVYVSLDSVGVQAEYIRSGMDYEKLVSNVRRLLAETTSVDITFINTFNIMSVGGFKDFLKLILDLRVEFGKENQNFPEIEIGDGFSPPFKRNQRQRVWFDIPFLQFPNWMAMDVYKRFPEVEATLNECLDFMIENKSGDDYYLNYHGFKDHEIAKLKRTIAWLQSANHDETKIERALTDFYMYFSALDQRRNTNFVETFPEMSHIWDEAKKLHDLTYL